MLKIINVVGARPNFMKVAPLIDEMRKFPEQIKPILVHTEQHYDENMSKLFFRDLEIPEPDICLGVGSGTHAEQTGKVMVEFEKVLLREKPGLVIVVGDVNSTIACALAAVKLHIPVAHVEAGLRSFDRTMPEEINRILTDAISDYLFVTEKSGEENLLKEGVAKEKIFFVGDVMIDSLLKNKKKADASNILSDLKLNSRQYSLLTLHRPSNVDSPDTFRNIVDALNEIQQYIKIVFPVHPRTRKAISTLLPNLLANTLSNIIFTEPLGYLDFLKLMSNAKFIMTDSGGIQEETTLLKIPCLTLRNTTERPVTIEQGTNILVGTDKDRIIKEAMGLLNGGVIKNQLPDLWDGKAAERIIKILIKNKNEKN